jgi:hypothetical protein
MESKGPALSKRKALIRVVPIVFFIVLDVILLVADKSTYIVPFLSKSQEALHAVDPFVVARYALNVYFRPTCTPPLLLSTRPFTPFNWNNPQPASPMSAEDTARKREYDRCVTEITTIERYGLFGIVFELSGFSLVLALISYGLFFVGWQYWLSKNKLSIGQTGGLVPILIGGTAALFVTKYVLYTLVFIFGYTVAAIIWINAIAGALIGIVSKGRHLWHQMHELRAATAKARETPKG